MRIAIDPNIFAFLRISGELNWRSGEVADKNARGKITQVVMIGHDELLAGYLLHDVRPAGLGFHDMAESCPKQSKRRRLNPCMIVKLAKHKRGAMA